MYYSSLYCRITHYVSHRAEKLHKLEKTLKKNTSELIALAIDEIYNIKQIPTEGERVLAILQKKGYLGSMPDVADLSENYKDYLDWGDKV